MDKKQNAQVVCISADDLAEMLILTGREVACDTGMIGALSAPAIAMYGTAIISKLVPDGKTILDRKIDELSREENENE